MRFWLVTIGEPLPTDEGNERLHRAGILAEMLVDVGHEVVWWTSTFNHSTKQLRAQQNTTVALAPRYTIKMLHGGGYRRNVSVARLRDHRRIARGFSECSRTEPRPDAIVASLPSLELCEAAALYGRAAGVPVVVDVRDLWPDVFADALPTALRALAPIALKPLRRVARSACTNASAIWGHAPAFVEWGLAHAGRARGGFDRSFPFGYAVAEPSEAEQRSAREIWSSLGAAAEFDGITACFIGTIGYQTDVSGIVEAARASSRSPHVRFIVCGDGDRLDRVRVQAKGLPNIVFAGWQRRAAIWSLLRFADVGIAPYVNRTDFLATIPNKVPEYLSGGLPIALNLSCGLISELIAEHQCGFTYHQDPFQLATRLQHLHENRAELAFMSVNARALFDREFRADVVYGEMIALLEALVHSGERTPERRPV